MKITIAVSLIIVFLIVSYWLGEAGRGIFQMAPYLIGVIGIVAIYYPISRRWKYRILFGLIFIVFYATGFYLGDLSFYRAYKKCVEDAEQIRTAIADFKTKNGKYPATLDDLNMPLPCKRCLRGTILEYESTASNYKIWFKDWLVEYSATDKDPFLTHK